MERMTHGSYSQARPPSLGSVRPPRRQAPLALRAWHQRQAERVAERLKENVQSEALVEPTAATLGTYLEQCLETHVRLHNAPRTYKEYRYHVERFLQPRLGHLRLTQLRLLHL